MTDNGIYSNSAKALRTLIYLMAAGITAVILFACQNSSSSALSVIGTGLIIAGSSMLSGSLLGFLFGVPRTLQQKERTGLSTDTGDKNTEKRVSYAANTNLEQISDWLTKIFVGVSLTQINNIPGFLKHAAQFGASGLGIEKGGIPFVFFLIIYFSVAGFLYTYLWTRLYLAGALREADRENDARINAMDKEIKTMQNQKSADAKALTVTDRQLDMNEYETPIPQEKLDKIIAASSIRARTTIFYQAQKARLENKKREEDKPKMERTIPIFTALIHADPNYHRDHAQLAYVFKDKRKPDYDKAIRELSTAIDLRGSWREKGYLFYEMHRALCRINQTENNAAPWISDQGTKQAIIEDIREVYNGELYDKIADHPCLHTWMEKNNVNKDDFR